jgi:N-acetylmuramoyl-L-alanine amidase
MQRKTVFFIQYFILHCFFFLPILLASTNKATIKHVRFWHNSNKTRIVFDLSHPVKHQLFLLSQPSRLVIDIPSVQLFFNIKNKLPPNNPLIQDIRQKIYADHLRIVFDFKKKISSKSFLLKPYNHSDHRLVIDLEIKELKKSIHEEKIFPQPFLIHKKTRKKPLKSLSVYLKNNQRDIIIAIDAGHGGEDPGAVGKKGTQEKKITLSVAKRLQKLIKNQPGFQAILTRKHDFYVGLKKRTHIARKKQVDLFISLHADGFSKKQVRGASIWVLSTKGANSEMGRWLEEREKRSNFLVGVDNLFNKDPLVAQVLLDLSMHYSTGESLKIAYMITDEFKRQRIKMHGKSIRKANFVVLRMPDIPALLIELAFISNPQEEQLLKTSLYQKSLSKAIFKAIMSYFKQKNKHSFSSSEPTKKKKSDQNLFYYVRPGDTLSNIAKKNQISLKQLKKQNNLRYNKIKIGQKLLIFLP